MKRKVAYILAAFLFPAYSLFCLDIKIDSPLGGFTKKKVQTISGKVTGFNKDRATLIINGVPQGMVLGPGARPGSRRHVG